MKKNRIFYLLDVCALVLAGTYLYSASYKTFPLTETGRDFAKEAPAVTPIARSNTPPRPSPNERNQSRQNFRGINSDNENKLPRTSRIGSSRISPQTDAPFATDDARMDRNNEIAQLPPGFPDIAKDLTSGAEDLGNTNSLRTTEISRPGERAFAANNGGAPEPEDPYQQLRARAVGDELDEPPIDSSQYFNQIGIASGVETRRD